jgi:hypothetical protein
VPSLRDAAAAAIVIVVDFYLLALVSPSSLLAPLYINPLISLSLHPLHLFLTAVELKNLANSHPDTTFRWLLASSVLIPTTRTRLPRHFSFHTIPHQSLRNSQKPGQ